MRFGWFVAVLLAGGPAFAAGDDCKPGPDTKCTKHDATIFGDDPKYEDKPYSGEAQQEIYGGKHLNPTQRPGLELGRELYTYGPFQPAPAWLGEANLLSPQLLVFGDVRTAIAANDNGAVEKGLFAMRANIDVDLRLTATERLHAFFNPLSKNGKFTRCEFFMGDHEDCFKWELEPVPEAAFFEGDLGAMTGGLIGRDQPFDLPVAGGLVPLLFQNGIWVEDAFLGGAFTIPARNSRTLDISNFDVTFFTGLDRVTTSLDPTADSHQARIFGATAFLEALRGYFELGYGYTEDRTNQNRDYHNLTAAFTRRYFDRFSNSIRVVGNVGQSPDRGVKKTANGVAFLVENSLITPWPSTVVPYINAFVGIDRPQPLARGAGLLKNTGIAFESDALTGFPFLNDQPRDAFGGAVGLEILGSNFGWQFVVEVAGRRNYRDDSGADQIGGALRIQIPLTNALILRTDGIYAFQSDGLDDLRAARVELRYKF